MKYITAVLLSLMLIGCGGSDNEQPQPTPSEPHKEDVFFGESSWGEGTW
ncbi:hypothetical protein [Vibrio comitans]|uniref:Lipoprotein n=1 Tax=Vibrio comitans NBRC 102076 TaxID=1219078 RepID=A0A4Y3IPI4_9VIBR|nr:hypothetical protein [Vibrio comitans]GEA60754.1 hypothetical protein VCO01S_19470 [Vibrio comitans NBRC 102076]